MQSALRLALPSPVYFDSPIRRIRNPLSGIPKKDLLERVSGFCAEHGLQDKVSTFHKGALVAQSPEDFESIPELDEDDKYHLRREITRMSRHYYI